MNFSRRCGIGSSSKEPTVQVLRQERAERRARAEKQKAMSVIVRTLKRWVAVRRAAFHSLTTLDQVIDATASPMHQAHTFLQRTIVCWFAVCRAGFPVSAQTSKQLVAGMSRIVSEMLEENAVALTTVMRAGFAGSSAEFVLAGSMRSVRHALEKFFYTVQFVATRRDTTDGRHLILAPLHLLGVQLLLRVSNWKNYPSAAGERFKNELFVPLITSLVTKHDLFKSLQSFLQDSHCETRQALFLVAYNVASEVPSKNVEMLFIRHVLAIPCNPDNLFEKRVALLHRLCACIAEGTTFLSDWEAKDQIYLYGNVLSLGCFALARYSNWDVALLRVWHYAMEKILYSSRVGRTIVPALLTHCTSDAKLSTQLSVLWGKDGLDLIFFDLVDGLKGVSNTKGPIFPALRSEKRKDDCGVLVDLKSVAGFTGPSWQASCEVLLFTIHQYKNSAALFSVLCAAPRILPPLWRFCEGLLPAFVQYLKMHARGDQLPLGAEKFAGTAVVSLALFAVVLAHFLTVIDDHEFVVLQVPFSLECVRRIVGWSNRVLYASGELMCGTCATHHLGGSLLRDDLGLRYMLRSVLRLLRDRANRTQFVPASETETYWLLDGKVEEALFPPAGLPKTALAMRILSEIPHVVPFKHRVTYVKEFVIADRRRVSAENVKYGIKIRRTHIVQDAFQQIMQIPSGEKMLLRARFHIQFVDAHGIPEAGIDTGGVFKEFLEIVVKRAFSPEHGLLCATAENDLYLNPRSPVLFPSSRELNDNYRFLGRILGKAVYEGCVVPIRFAPFFINNLLGRGNTLDDLKLLDPQQHSSLLKLKELANVEDACLFFCIEEDFLGEKIVTDLMENGRNIPVTNDNVVRFLHLLARHRLCGDGNMTKAFLSGLFDVLEREWIQLFDSMELQQLISGSKNARMDLKDLRRHLHLVGGFDSDSRTINLLFEVLEELNDVDQGRFLQFVTGSSNPPLLGFGSMNPPFSIRQTEEGSAINYLVDLDALPSASTCFNLLKLPPYKNKKNMKEKLLQAIRSGAGFDLS